MLTTLLLLSLAAGDEAVTERLTPDEPSPFPSTGAQVRMNVGFDAEWGVFPESLLGATVALRVGNERWSGLLEAWTVFPTAVEVSATGSVDAFAVGGIGGVCGQWVVSTVDLSGCLLGRGGALLISPRNDETVNPSGWQPTASAGGRVSVEWPRNSVLGLFVSAQLFVPVLRPYFRSDERSWFQPMVYGGGRIGFLLRFR